MSISNFFFTQKLIPPQNDVDPLASLKVSDHPPEINTLLLKAEKIKLAALAIFLICSLGSGYVIFVGYACYEVITVASNYQKLIEKCQSSWLGISTKQYYKELAENTVIFKGFLRLDHNNYF